MVDRMNDHTRGCQGREYTCSCGYDDQRDAEILRLRAEVEELTRSRDEWLAAAVEQRKKAERLTTDPAYQIGYNVGRAEATAEAMERAAQIADGATVPVRHHPSNEYLPWPIQHRDIIAAAIRAEASKKGGEG